MKGIKNFAPIWTDHAIRILPGPSSLWLDARGRRLPAPLYPGFDTLRTLKYIMETGYDYSWFILTQKIIAKEFALSGSEQNPDFTSKSWLAVIRRARAGIPGPVRAFMDKGEDFIVEPDLPRLVARMNALSGEALLTLDNVEREIVARDRELDNRFGKDGQIAAIHNARRYIGDKLIRVARAAQAARSRRRPADCGAAQYFDAQDAGRLADRSRQPRHRRRRRTGAGALCGR